MSKVWRKPIEIPAGVEITIQGDHIAVKGPKGTLQRDIYPGVVFTQKDNILEVSAKGYEMRKFWWLMRALVQNMITGVHTGFTNKMLVTGVGYTAKASGSNGIEFTLGLSHKVQFAVPEGVKIGFEKDPKNNDIIVLESIDKEQLGQVCSKIKAVRPPEPYKGAGIRFANEKIKLKPGKTASK